MRSRHPGKAPQEKTSSVDQDEILGGRKIWSPSAKGALFSAARKSHRAKRQHHPRNAPRGQRNRAGAKGERRELPTRGQTSVLVRRCRKAPRECGSIRPSAGLAAAVGRRTRVERRSVPRPVAGATRPSRDLAAPRSSPTGLYPPLAISL